MYLFVSNLDKNIKYNVEFGAKPAKNATKKVVTEISDDIFKLASAAVTATGIATLGIAASKMSENQVNLSIDTEQIIETEPVKSESNLITRTELAKRLGINLMTVCNAVNRGDIIIDSETNLIDINNPKNSEFISRAKAAVESAKQRGKKRVFSFVTKPAAQEIVSKAELAKKLDVKLPTIIYHIQKGHIIINSAGDIDLSDAKNKNFIATYKKRQVNAKPLEQKQVVERETPTKPDYKKMTSEELGGLYKKLLHSFVLAAKELLFFIKKKRISEVGDLSIDDLKLKLLENSYSENVSKNQKLNNSIEFLYGHDFQAEEEINILKTFVVELLNFNDSNLDFFGKRKFSEEVIKKAEALEIYTKNKEQKRQAKYEHVVSSFNEKINSLYANKLTTAADICFKYMPHSVEDTEKIKDAEFLISVIEGLNIDISVAETENSYLNAEAEIERLRNIAARSIEYAIIGFDAEKSNSERYQEARKYTLSHYGSEDYKYIGEYIVHSENIDSINFDLYPEFCKDLMLEISTLDKNEAVEILFKLDEWEYLSEHEKNSFCKFCELFSKNNPVEFEIIKKYVENYYLNCDTVVMAINFKDEKTKIPATFNKSGKESMYKQVAPGKIVDYIEEFESAMTKLVGKSGSCGIKDYKTDKKKSHEVKTSYPARLYCCEKDFVFDTFEYYGGH